MHDFLSFFLVLLVGLIFSEIFSKFHLPLVVALIVGGMIIGPFGLNVFVPNPTIEFLGEIGLVFLMFMAGLEIKFSSFRQLRGEVFKISSLNGLIPLSVGLAIGLYFDLGIMASLLLGIIFVSSSIAVIIPSLEASGLLRTRLGHTITASTIIEDVVSLILLSIFLQAVSPTTPFPLPLFYAFLLFSLIALRFVIPKIYAVVATNTAIGKNLFEREIRFVFLALVGVVILFEVLGLHSIIAGFFTGLIFSDLIRSNILREKLHTVSYSLFIPVFFIVVGSQTNIRLITEIESVLLLTLALILGSIGSKFFSGWLAGRLSKFSNQESFAIGVATIPQLSTTLAVVITGFELGILDQNVVTAMVVLSIVTTFVAPTLIHGVARRMRDESSLMQEPS